MATKNKTTRELLDEVPDDGHHAEAFADGPDPITEAHREGFETPDQEFGLTPMTPGLDMGDPDAEPYEDGEGPSTDPAGVPFHGVDPDGLTFPADDPVEVDADAADPNNLTVPGDLEKSQAVDALYADAGMATGNDLLTQLHRAGFVGFSKKRGGAYLEIWPINGQYAPDPVFIPLANFVGVTSTFVKRLNAQLDPNKAVRQKASRVTKGMKPAEIQAMIEALQAELNGG